MGSLLFRVIFHLLKKMSGSYDKQAPEVQKSVETPNSTGTAQSEVQNGPDHQALDESQTVLTGEKSPGVARIEAINRHLTTHDRIALSIGVFLIAYAYGLDSTVRYTYQVIRIIEIYHRVSLTRR